MKHLYFRWLGLLAVLAGIAQPTRGQQAINLPNRTFAAFECYPTLDGGRSLPISRPTASEYGPYGKDVTPRGDLRVLIIYAGFTNDINAAAPGFGSGPWPQQDATHAPGTTFPVNAGGGFYTNINQFNTSATDQTLSNFYYQMSQFSTSPLRMYATVFPKRINVTADDLTSLKQNGGFETYTKWVMAALQSDPDTKNFDFSQVDSRQNKPDFQFDNSAPGADHIVDYAIIVWRNPGKPYGLQNVVWRGGGGWASVPNTPNIAQVNGQTYTINTGFTHTLGMDGVSPPIFAHEFAHGYLNCPHYLGANGTTGRYFNSTEGPGMMGFFRTFFAANAWERWISGWAELKTSGVSSDIQGSGSLAATGGIYTLRDFITTGDMVRIKLPNSSQYLWLENHQGYSVYDERNEYIMDGQAPSQPFRSPPRGIVGIIENIAPDRTGPMSYIDSNGANGLKVLSAQGNFDYTHSASTSAYNGHVYGNQLYNYTNLLLNPFGGESQISQHRFDANGDGKIDWSSDPSGASDEKFWSVVVNGNFEDGFLGPDVAFNAGQKLGISYPVPIVEHQSYDDGPLAKLSPNFLNGLSVELLSQDSQTKAITIRVRYDDVTLVADTRWTGEIQVTNAIGPNGPNALIGTSSTGGTSNRPAPTTSSAPDVDLAINGGVTLTVNKSGTPNRHTPTSIGDFINPTRVVCLPGTLVKLNTSPLDIGSTIDIGGYKTVFYVAGEIQLGRSCEITVQSGALLDLTQNADVKLLSPISSIRIKAGGSLIVRGGNISGLGSLTVEDGGYICVIPNNNPLTCTKNISSNAIIGISPIFNNYPFSCSSNFRIAQNSSVTPISAPYAVVPNPAADQVSISLPLHQASQVQISLQDLSGAPRLTLPGRSLEAGTHTLNIPLNGVTTGVYMLVVETAEDRHITRLQVNH